MFGKRVISAVALLAFAAVVLISGGYVLLAVSGMVAIAATYEFLKVDNMNKTVPGCISYISVISFYLAFLWKNDSFFEIWAVFTVVFLLCAYVGAYPKYHIKNIGICVLAVFYVAVLISYIYRIRCLEYGNWLVWMVLICASGSDTFAYFTGILIGKHHFSELSPKKTVEGCVGGVVGAALLAFAYSYALPAQISVFPGTKIHLIFAGIGAIGSVVSQIGDLAASAVKRNYGIKDYSNLIPGHGGILDRFDSILFVAPLVYYLIEWFMH
jgi:phosphatidate cytidylyltransferase